MALPLAYLSRFRRGWLLICVDGDGFAAQPAEYTPSAIAMMRKLVFTVRLLGSKKRQDIESARQRTANHRCSHAAGEGMIWGILAPGKGLIFVQLSSWP
jgi:hypothetical protein